MFALWERNPEWYATHTESLKVIWPPSEGYLATRGLFLEAKRIADAHGWCIPLLVAHPEHIQRCFHIARKIFGNNSCTTTDYASFGWIDWFDPKSVQWWTRGPWRWFFYEIFIARPHHLLHGWM